MCAIAPWDFEAWLLEQFATLIGLTVLAWCLHHNIHFPAHGKISIALLFVVHTIGTHFTYSLTPYDSFIYDFSGFSINEAFGWQRNHYDRFVHLMYGVCLALPIAYTLQQRLEIRSSAAKFLAFHIVISTSAIYELIEWVAALLFGGDLGMMYLGTQGDIWDAQADIALAGAGQLVVYIFAVVVRRAKTRVSSDSGKHVD
jgi:putative membrane protein